MTKFETEEEFSLAFRRLEALSDEYSGWKRTDARKDHVDLFGQQIKDREEYFEKLGGMPLKLSRQSMEKVLIAVFGNSGIATTLADALLAEQQRKIYEAGEIMSRHLSFLNKPREKRGDDTDENR